MSKVTRDELVDFLKQCGWKTDRYGHLRNQITVKRKDTGERVVREYRIKLQATSCRVELQALIGDHNEWLRLTGAYYKDVVRLPDGRLRIGTGFFKKSEVLG